ncbi:cadherin-like domain-containing protein [Zoogloea sp.]|uniref:cadherin-like domain-containing protein n=1 Tax=Zoogloea sp. TaxID=49181 RepID=UPI0025E03EA7|nr:cadherin-like domain-containing protein [Zoogloea sp.]MCK6394415.1 Ig-like domain-containing protein [Zoogloea sp.]
MSTRVAQKSLRPVSHRLALEPRHLFDGAAPVTIDQHDDSSSHPATDTRDDSQRLAATAERPASPAGQTGRTELVIVDPAVRGWQELVAGLPAGSEVLVLDPARSGLEQIASALNARDNITTLHLISHGAADQIVLGNQSLDTANLEDFRSELAAIGSHLSASADILIYGCDVASQGTAFIDRLAALTGADVAASTNLTGSAGSGGDTTLEAASGSIEASALALNGLNGLLAAPTITDSINTTRSGTEDSNIAISGITIADSDGNSQTVTLSSTTGTLTLAGTTGLTGLTGNGTGTVSFSGTLADINAAINGMNFRGLPEASGAADFTIATNDGSTTVSRTVNLAITPTNDVPVLAGGTPLSVSEGGSASFSAATNVGAVGFNQVNLGLSDVDNTQNQVIIKVTGLPGQGVLKLAGNELSVGSTFAVSQIAQLSYTHNGSQVLAPTNDTFLITVDDGAGGLLTNQVVTVAITPVNQAPTVAGTVTVFEGEQDVSLTANTNLVPPVSTPRGAISGSDPDDTVFSYSITSLPTHGTLKYDGVAITTASAGSPFIVADLNKLTYSHDGSEPGGTPDTFNMRITDSGGGTGVSLSHDTTIEIGVIGNNNDPVLTNDVTQTLTGTNTSLTVTPAMLQVTDTDSPDSSLTYTLTAVPNPAEGYFSLGGTRLVAGATFTQQDITDGRLAYITLSATPRTDSISFTVKDGDRRIYPTPRDGGIYVPGTDTLAVNTFSINVQSTGVDGSPVPPPAPVNDVPSTGGSNAAALLEGQTIILDNTQLTATDPDTVPGQLTYRVLSLPTSGSIRLNGVALEYFDSFTQADVNAGRVTFAHAGGEDFNDVFTYSVSDGSTETAVRNFTLTITPQNDTPTATNGDRVFGPEGSSITITPANIVLADADNSASDNETGYAVDNTLRFQISGNVSHGSLTLDGVAIGVGDYVTAAELAAGKLVYTHDSSENFTDSFRLVPMDDQNVVGGTATNHVSTGTELIVPITLTPVNDAPQYQHKSQLISGEAGAITEGATATIGGALGYANTNGITGAGTPTLPANSVAHLVYGDTDNSTEQRQYRITTAPANGSLLLSGAALSVGSVFTQADLDSGRITYRHNGSETSSDFFDYVVSDGDFVSNDSSSVPQGSTPTPSRYNIELNPANDKPTISAAGSSLVVNSALTPVALPAITLADLDVAGGIGAGEQDFVQVTAEFLTAADAPFAAGVLSFNGALPGGVTVINAAGDNTVVFQGSLADVQAALNQLRAATDGSDPDLANLKIKISVDDRLRDASGALTAGANGGTTNADGTPIDATNNVASVVFNVAASDTNDPPVITNPTPNQTVNEDVRSQITGFSFSDPDAFSSTTNTITLTAGTGSHIYFGSTGSSTPAGLSVTAGAVGSNTVTLRGSATDLNAALTSLYYQSATHYNGDDTLTLTVDDGGNTGIDGGGTGSDSEAIAIAIRPVNDAPTLSMPSGTKFITDGSFEFTGLGNTISFNDAADISNAVAGFEVGVDNYTITLNAQLSAANYGTIQVGTTTGLSVTSSTGNVVLTGNRADLLAALATVSYQPTDTNVNGAITFRVTVDDGDNGGTQLPSGISGPTSATNTFTLITTDQNEAPSIAGLDATSANTYSEGGAAIVVDANATLVDPELDIYPSWNGAVLTIERQGGANAQDVFGVTGSGTTGINFSGANIRNGSTVVGSFTNSGGTLTITFNSSATAAIADSVLQAVTYRNSSDAPPASVTLAYSINDQNPNTTGGGSSGSGQDQGGGGQLSGGGNILININQVVDNPVLSAGAAKIYTENNPALSVDNAITLSDADDTQMSGGTISLTSGFLPGDVLAVDTTGTTITASYDAGTGVLTLSGSDTTANYQSVLRSLTYLSTSEDPNNNDTPANRSRTVTYSLNDGGSSGAGTGTGTTARLINIVPINDTPALGGAGSTLTFTENDPALLLEPTGWTLTDVDDTQMVSATVQISAGLGSGDTLAAGTLPAGWTQSYDAGTGTLTLSGTATNVANVLAALETVRYSNASESPSTTPRTISWQVRDANSDAASNGTQLSNILTTTLNVVAVPDAPVAVDDVNSITEGAASVIGNVKPGTPGQDSDLDNTNAELGITGIRTGTEAGGGTMSPISAGTTSADGTIVTGLYGSLRIGADGSYTYTLDNTNPAVNALKTGDTLTEIFSYTLADPSALTDIAQLTITIDGVTDGGPSITPVDGNGAATGETTVFEAGLTAVADTSETGTGSIALSADDGLDSIRIDGTLVTLAQINALGTTPVTITTGKGVLTLTGFTASSTVGGIPTAGTLDYTYTLTADQTTPGVNESTDILALEINDAGGTGASGTLTIRIVDDEPTANADTNSVNEGFTTAPTTTSGNVFAAGSSGDAADRLGADVVPGPVTHVSFGATPGTVGAPLAGAYGSLTLAANGSYTYSLDNTHPTVAAMRAGDTLTEVFTYTITDKDGDVATTTLTITINGQNDPPVAVDDGILVTAEDTPLRGIPVLSNDSDPENDPLTVTSATIPPEQGAVTVNPDGTLDFIPAPNFHGTAVITYTISDGHGGTDTATVTIQITPVDDVPIAVDDVLETQEDTPLSGSLTGNDTPSGDGGNVWAKATNPAHGSVVVNPDGSFIYTPNPDYHGPDSFTYTITDADGDVSTATVTLTVKPVNDPPTGTDKTVTLKDGQNRPLSPADFGYADPDQDPMTSVRIDTLPPDARLLLDGVPVVPGQVISIADLNAGKLVLVPGAATRTQTFDFSVFDGQLFQVSPNTFTALVEFTPDVILPKPEVTPPGTGPQPLSPLDFYSQPSEQRWPVPRLFPPFVPALHVLPGVADVAIERGIGSGIVANLADRATVGEVRSALLGDYLGDSHALYVQHAVRHEPIATTHALHVQHSVRLSQAEAEIADAQSSSRGNTAAAGVTSLLDPFAIGAPTPATDTPAVPTAGPDTPPAAHSAAPVRQAAEGFSSQIRNAASDLRPRAAQTSRSPLAPSAKR